MGAEVGIEHQRRRSIARVVHIGGEGQRLVIGPDQSQGFLRSGHGRGGNGSNRRAGITDDGAARSIRPRGNQDRANLWVLLGCGRVDAAYLGMRVRRAQNLGVKHAGKLDIHSVARRARNFGPGILPRYGLADR